MRGGRTYAAFFAALFLVLSFIMGTTAVGALSSSELKIGQVNGEPGAIVKIPVVFTSTDNIGGMQFNVAYDHSLLTYQSFETAELGSGFSVDVHPADEKLRVLIYSPQGKALPSGTVTLAVLTFKVAENAVEAQKTKLELSGVTLSDPQGNNVLSEMTLSPGQFTVSPAVEQSRIEVGQQVGVPIAGAVIKIPVTLQSVHEVGGVQFDVNYNKTLLEYQAVYSELTKQGFTVSAGIVDGKLRVVLHSNTGAKIPHDSAVSVLLSFKVAEGAGSGQSTDVELSGAVLSDPVGNPITTSTLLANGKVTIAYVQSSDPAHNTIELGEPQGLPAPGKTIKIPVVLKNENEVSGLQVELVYDKRLLTYQEITSGELPSGVATSANVVNDRLRIVVYSDSGKKIPPGNVTLAWLTFRVQDAAEKGQNIALTLAGPILADAQGNNITDDVMLVNRQFAVESAVPYNIIEVGQVSGTAAPEGTVQIPILLKNENEVSGIQFDLSYNKALLAYQEAAVGTLPPGFAVSANPKDDKLKVLLYSQNGAKISKGNTTAILLTFKVPATAEQGQKTPLTLSDVRLSDSNGQGLVVRPQNGELTIDAKTIDECFIATAAYGSKFQPAVVLLRHFRDEYLLTNALGQEFVKLYYHYSPPIAQWIAGSEELKSLVRTLLTPVVGIVYLLFHPKLMLSAIALMLAAGVLLYRRWKNLYLIR